MILVIILCFHIGGISGEIIVFSKQLGKIIMDQDMEYQPSARLYFDMKKIAENGLLVRDGCHLKVKHILSLFSYLIWVATWKSVGLEYALSTPKEFTELSNSTFNKLFHKKLSQPFNKKTSIFSYVCLNPKCLGYRRSPSFPMKELEALR